MPSKTILANLPNCVVVLLLCVGCEGLDSSPKPNTQPQPQPLVAAQPNVPVEVLGTVAEHALLISGGSLPVDGYGLVAGLGKNGSSECPPAIESYLIEDLQKKHVGSWLYGTRELTPKMILRDLDTAVVVVRADVPPGAYPGQRFDVTVTCLPQTQTRTLDGGILMPTDLRRSLGGGMPIVGAGGAAGKVMGKMVCGAVFLNPFLDPTKPADMAKCRTGRILGGGAVLESRPIYLQLYQPDHSRLRRLQDRICERFPTRDLEVAHGVGNQIIELKIPPAYHDDLEHFTQLVMHLPLVGNGGAVDQQAQRVAKMMEGPTQRHEDLALILEAMGRQVEPVLRGLYTSSNEYAQYYAARTGLRLGDTTAAEVVIRHATSANSRFQLAAIEELGRHKQVYRAGTALRDLLDDDNKLVRIAAYESLRRRGDPTIETWTLDEEFILDLVPSSKEYMIYARQSGQPRIALFGKKMPVQCPMFYNSPDDLVTVNARAGDKELLMFRKVARTGQLSNQFRCNLVVADMLKLWGKIPERDLDQKVLGMGLTYGQAVSNLCRMCKEGSIPAKFVLQDSPDAQKMSEGTTSTGRPDLSE